MSRVDIPVVVPWMRECAVHIIRTAYEVQGRPEIIAGMIEAEATELAKVIADYAPKRRTITDRRLEEAENEILDLRTRIRQLEPVEYPSSPQVSKDSEQTLCGETIGHFANYTFLCALHRDHKGFHQHLFTRQDKPVGSEVKPRTGEGS